MWDTAGSDDFSDLRPLSYNDADVFIICFSIVEDSSLDNAAKKWKDELLKLGPKDCPIILCGTKSDLRDEYIAQGKDRNVVLYNEGKQV